MAATRFEARGLLFDLDGTLIDSARALERCWTRWAIEYDLTREHLASVVAPGRTSAEMVSRLLPPARVAGALARIEELESAETREICPMPGVVRLLKQLPDDRYGIVTSSTRAVAGTRLEAAGLLEPTVLVTADDVRRAKPDPEPFLLGAQRLGVPPTDCLVVEDAPAGLESARSANMATIAVSTTTTEAELIADALIEDFDCLRVETSGDRLIIQSC